MKQFFIKHFRKNECVKIFLIESDKRIKVKYVIPNNNFITIGDKTFNLIEDKLFYNNGIPSFICSYKSAEPINPNELNKIIMKPEDYNTAISAQVAKEIFSVTSNKIDMQMIAVILSVLSVVGVIVLYVTMSDLFTQLFNQLENLKITTEGVTTT